MERVAQKDQPKLIAAAAILIVALASIAVSLLRMRNDNHSPQTVVALNTPAQAAVSEQATSREDAVWVTSNRREENESAIATLAQRRDPFHPLPVGKGARTPVSIRASGLPTAEPTPGHGAGSPLAAPVLPGAFSTAGSEPGMPGAWASKPVDTTTTTGAPRLPPTASPTTGAPPATPLQDVVLAGTVGTGPSAVAAFRIGEGLVPIRCSGEVAGWRVTRIEGARVWLARGGSNRRLRVGQTLAAGGNERLKGQKE